LLALIICGFSFAFLFGAFGIHFRRGKGIQWVNFLDYKREKYDEPKLLQFLSGIMFSFALTGVFWILSGIFSWMWLFYIGTGYLACMAVFTCIYINTGKRFEK
jgi:hypothetical protein